MTRGREEQHRAEEAARQVRVAARVEAAARTGWEPWMTWLAGYAALGPGWVEHAEYLDWRRGQYGPEADAARKARRRREQQRAAR